VKRGRRLLRLGRVRAENLIYVDAVTESMIALLRFVMAILVSPFRSKMRLDVLN